MGKVQDHLPLNVISIDEIGVVQTALMLISVWFASFPEACKQSKLSEGKTEG